MAKVKKSSWVLLNLLCAPVHYASAQVAKRFPHNRKAAHVCFGGILIFTGATLASVQWPFCPHVVSEGLAWLIHSFGCAPIIDAVLKD